ncbi:hypothetical protein ACF0H5_004853 [Mactra antiquata]
MRKFLSESHYIKRHLNDKQRFQEKTICIVQFYKTFKRLNVYYSYKFRVKMRKIVGLLFIVKLLTQPVIGTFKQSNVNRRLTGLENKLDLLFEGLAKLRADVKANYLSDDELAYNHSTTNSLCTTYDVNTIPYEDQLSTLEEMLIKTKIHVLYTGFKELKQAVSIPIKAHKLQIDHIGETQTSVLQKMEDHERSMYRYVDSSNKLRETMNSLQHEIQAQQENTSNEIKKFKGIAKEIKTKFDDKLTLVTDEVRNVETKFDDRLKGIETMLNEMSKTVHNLEQNTMPLTCQPGWHQYRFTCYYLNETGATWNDAVNYCTSFGAQLVEYNDMQEINFVLQLASSSNVNWGSSRWRGFYVGGSDFEREGYFTWKRSKNKVLPLNWLPGQPDNGGNKEHCMMTLVNQGGKWNDNPCNRKDEFVCEKELSWEKWINKQKSETKSSSWP